MSNEHTSREQQRAESGTTRRSFLGGLGTGSGYLLVGEWTDTLANQSSPSKVQIYAGSRKACPEAKREGRLYFAIDTGERLYDTGDEWVLLDVSAESGVFETLTVGDLTSELGKDLASDHNEYNPHFPRLAEQSGPPVIQPHPDVSNPVLTGDDVTDMAAEYIADPFLVYEDSIYHMFFEILPEDEGPAVIGHATSVDGIQWSYNQVVLDVDDFDGDPHASFPYVFKWEGDWYMMPERAGQNIEIYKASSFPTNWELVERPFTMDETGDFIADAVPIYWEGTWYLIYGDRDPTALRLRYSDTLIDGDWTEHPMSPIQTGPTFSRGGGRPIVYEDHIDVFVQDVERTYGDKVRVLRITELTKDEYTDQELPTSPLIEGNINGEWNSNAMHHVDMLMPYLIENDIVAVDGNNPDADWSIGIYTTGESDPTAARASLSDVQSIESGSFVTVALNQLAHDVSQSFDTDDYQYVVPSSGYYRIEGQVTLMDIETDSESFTLASRLYNASAESSLAEQYTSVGANGSASSLASTTAYLNDENIIQLQGWQDADQTLQITSSTASTYLTIRRIR